MRWVGDLKKHRAPGPLGRWTCRCTHL